MMTLPRSVRQKLALSRRTLACTTLSAACLMGGIAIVPVSACTKESEAATRPGSAAPPSSTMSALAAGPHADGEHFSVDAAQAGACSPGRECAVVIRVTVRDDFHVNLEFPHKFTAQDADGVEFLGKDPAKKNVFSKSAGDFVSTDPKSGVMSVRFKSQAGAKTIQGTLKIGVCSEQNCLLPQVDLAVPVTVK